jgi:Fic family protein
MFENLNLKINEEMISIISEIDEFKGSWKLLGQMTPEKLKSLKKVATIESVGSSNRIEGNKLSDNQVEELLSRISKQSFANRDEEEVAGYAKLADTIFDDWEVIPLSENYIKQMHKILLEYSSKDEKHKGEYKKISNSVVAYDSSGKEIGIVFETATPFETPIKMQQLIEWTNKNLDDKFYHPLIVIGVFIVNFLAIHPFQDGNGRLSRALTNLLLLKSGYLYIPYSSTEAVVEDNKDTYYRALRQTQTSFKTKVDYEPWLMFFLKTLQKQKIRLEYKLDMMTTKTNSNIDLPIISAKIMEVFAIKERATISEISELTAVNQNTIKKHLAKLVENNYLIKHGKTRGAWYTKK